MSQQTRNTYFRRAHLGVSRSIMQIRKPSGSFKGEKITPSKFQHRLNSSGLDIQQQKLGRVQNCKDLHKSADIAYFLEKERPASRKQQQSTQDANYSYIGQIQALQRRKNENKRLFRPLRTPKGTLQSFFVEIGSQKSTQQNKLGKIVVNSLKSNVKLNSKQEPKQIQVEEIHYSMVLAHQKCKKKCIE